VAGPAENASQGVPTEQTGITGDVPNPPKIVSEEAIRMMAIAALKVGSYIIFFRISWYKSLHQGYGLFYGAKITQEFC
jgi:hypothetical protein